MIKQDDRPVAGAGGFNAVAIQVEDQRITARWGCASSASGTTCVTRATSRAASIAATTAGIPGITRARTSAGSVIPPLLGINCSILLVLYLVMNMLFKLILSFWTTATHRANRTTCIYLLPDLHISFLGMEDLVTISICVTNLDGAVLAANKSYSATNGRVNCWMCQIDSRLSNIIIKNQLHHVAPCDYEFHHNFQ
nr:hypothetical protein [Verminephrobacter aporrectodeae]